ncbi:hypothetical protein M3Y99_01579800 [Aphelenchoides fujianensis]|nr:hypothetical protein M3Y99_01579800 [Aphelenchoides fujianensis]
MHNVTLCFFNQTPSIKGSFWMESASGEVVVGKQSANGYSAGLPAHVITQQSKATAMFICCEMHDDNPARSDRPPRQQNIMKTERWNAFFVEQKAIVEELLRAKR